MRAEQDVRASDDERRAVDATLQAAAGSGLITLAEYDERCAAVWSARTRQELALVTRDLPASSPAPGSVPFRRDLQAAAVASWGAVLRARRVRRERGVRRRDAVRLRRAGFVASAGAIVLAALIGVAAARGDSLAVFGSQSIAVGPGRHEVRVASIFGSTDISVPADAVVEVNGVQLFGSVDRPLPPPAPTTASRATVPVDLVIIRADGAFGSVTIDRDGQGDPTGGDG